MKTACALLALLLCGCGSTTELAKNGFGGWAVETHSRGVGLHVAASNIQGGTPMPDIMAGFFSTSFKLTPVNTNRLFAAESFDTFDSTQSGWNPFALNYAETSGSGWVATTNGGSAVLPKIVVPSLRLER